MHIYLIYKTTNLINNKYYVGSHKTSNINDDYYGSGKLLKIAIKKYGIENFKKEILYIFSNKEEMFLKEKEIVNEEFVKDKNNYNLKIGGDGGFDHLKEYIQSEKHKKQYLEYMQKGHIESQKKLKLLRTNIPEWQKKLNEKIKIGVKIYYSQNKGPFTDRKHSIETKEKISKKQKINQSGEKNSQFGTIWVNNGLNIMKIKKTEYENYEKNGWVKGRKII